MPPEALAHSIMRLVFNPVRILVSMTTAVTEAMNVPNVDHGARFSFPTILLLQSHSELHVRKSMRSHGFLRVEICVRVRFWNRIHEWNEVERSIADVVIPGQSFPIAKRKRYRRGLNGRRGRWRHGCSWRALDEEDVLVVEGWVQVMSNDLGTIRVITIFDHNEGIHVPSGASHWIECQVRRRVRYQDIE